MTYKSNWKNDPQEVVKLLSQFPRKVICRQLGICLGTLNNYIKKEQIQHPKKEKTKHEKPKRIGVDNSVHVEVKNPLELFKEQFEERKRKRIVQELKDGYY